jgi:hypothetical protein
MSHEPECTHCRDEELCLNPGCCECSCKAIRNAYKRGLNQAGEIAADLLQALEQHHLTHSEFIQAIKDGDERGVNLEQALNAIEHVRALAQKFEQEDNGDSQAMLRYQLAASRIYGALNGEQE